jgi:hypothetical protein
MNSREYAIAEGLDKLVDLGLPTEGAEGDVFATVAGKTKTAFSPKLEDLVRLHRLVRSRKSFTVLEFGVGHSTIVLADALYKNERDWSQLDPPPKTRNRFMFQLFSVDASEHWLENTRRQLPGHLSGRVHLHHSEVEIGTFCGQLCHFYKELPNIIPDFIYLDGPSPKDVKGQVRGLDFECDERTVMSGDLLLMESTFLPGTFVIVDGRTNNVRFLLNNFKRKYDVRWDRSGDVTTLELTEDRLGPYNLLGSDFLK